MNIITYENDTALLNDDISKKIAEFERQAKLIKDQEEELKKAILDEMENKGVIKLENDYLIINYIAATDRETLDNKRLREEKQDIYDEYIKITPVKSSIRIKVKEKNEEKEKLEKIKELIN